MGVILEKTKEDYKEGHLGAGIVQRIQKLEKEVTGLGKEQKGIY